MGGTFKPLQSINDEVSILGYKIVAIDATKKLSFQGMVMTDVGYQLVGLIQDAVCDDRFVEGVRSLLEKENKSNYQLVKV